MDDEEEEEEGGNKGVNREQEQKDRKCEQERMGEQEALNGAAETSIEQNHTGRVSKI